MSIVKINESQLDLRNTNAKIEELKQKFSEIAGGLVYKGNVETVDDLPTTGMENGYFYTVGPESLKNKPEYVYLNGEWEELGNTVNIPEASDDTKGVAYLATTEEAKEGFDDSKIMTPLKTAQVVADNAGRGIQLGFLGTLEGGVLTFETTDLTPYTLRHNYNYELDLLFEAVDELDDDIQVVIKNGDNTHNIVNVLHDDFTTPITIKDLKQAQKYTTTIGFRWLFDTKYVITPTGQGIFVAPAGFIDDSKYALKEEVETKADADDVYTKEEVDAKIQNATPNIPDNVYTEDNLIAGKDIEIVDVLPDGGIDEHTLACWHFDNNLIDVISNNEISYNDNYGHPNPVTDYYKFGGGSLADSSWLGNTTLPKMLKDTEDFTIDFWLMNTNQSANVCYTLRLIGYDGSDIYLSVPVLLKNSTQGYVFNISGINGKENYGLFTEIENKPTLANWTHIAFVYKNSSRMFKLYIDGNLFYEHSFNSNNHFNINIINWGWSGYRVFRIDEFRVSDIIRYTNNFVPPTEPYSVAEPTGKKQINFTGNIPEIDTSDLATKEEVETKADADDVYTKEEIDAKIQNATPNIPDNIYTEDNLLGGKDIEIIEQILPAEFDEHTLACWHLTSDFTNSISGSIWNNFKNVNGSGRWNTEISKFGDGSFNGSAITSSSEKMSNKEWTLDFQMLKSSTYRSGSSSYFFGERGDADVVLQINYGEGQNILYVKGKHLTETSGAIELSDFGINTDDNQFHHYAISKDTNGFVRVFVDGKLVYQIKEKANQVFKNNIIYTGYDTGNNNLLNEFRISDVCRYTEDFTPPTAPYPFTVATGKKVINYTGEIDTSNLATKEELSGYLPLSGGQMTGSIIAKEGVDTIKFPLDNGSYSSIRHDSTLDGRIIIDAQNGYVDILGPSTNQIRNGQTGKYYLDESKINVANGIAPLDANNKVPLENLPDIGGDKDINGIEADYCARYGITECPNGILEANGLTLTLKSGVVMQTAGSDTLTTVASDMVHPIESETDFYMFYAQGTLLECQEIYWQETEPETSANCAAWYNPDLEKWQFKSLDTDNVWTVANSAHRLAFIKRNDSSVTRINYIGCRVLDKPTSASVAVDSDTIVKNDDNTITAVGLKAKSDNVVYPWYGTLAEYEAGRADGSIPDTWECHVEEDGPISTSISKVIGSVYASFSNSYEDNPGALPLFTGETIEGFNTIYPDFYAWLTKDNSKTCTLDEYTTALETFGECVKFGIDNGTVRLPLIKNYIKAANSTDGIKNIEAGLPNITGKATFISSAGQDDDLYPDTGALYWFDKDYGERAQFTVASNIKRDLGIDASLSSEVYGRSTTVTPASTTLYYWIVAYTDVLPTSVAQLGQFYNAFATKVSLPEGKTNDDVDFVVDSYSDDNGNWYRVYKSGWVEQGGTTGSTPIDTVTFLKPFNSIPNVQTTQSFPQPDGDYENFLITNLTTTGFKTARKYNPRATNFIWMAAGKAE